MSIKGKSLLGLAVVFGLFFALYHLYPLLLFQLLEWQKSFNQQIASTLRNIHQAPQQAGLSLLLISFLYGVFHAIGPGHGKFILTSYLSLERTKLPQTLKITWLSAWVQGMVAVGLVTILVVIFTLSRHYFNLTLKWVERGSFLLMIGFGAYWLWQAFKPFWQKKHNQNPLVIRQIHSVTATSGTISPSNCNCGHKHLPTTQEMEQIQDWRSMWAVILSIGLRPCSGAVLVLFLAYTLDLYFWGIAATMAMATGTGLTLTLFAALVLFARHHAVQAGRWYLSIQTSKHVVIALKLVIGGLLVGVGIMLLHGSFIVSGGGILLR